MQIRKSFSGRNLHTWANQLLPVVVGQELSPPLPAQGLFFYRGLTVKPFDG